MKKTFSLTHPKIKYPRQIEASKAEIRKYLKRERNKKLPEGVDFWDFDCKYGTCAESAVAIHVAEVTQRIDEAQEKKLETFYLEILVKPGIRSKKSDAQT